MAAALLNGKKLKTKLGQLLLSSNSSIPSTTSGTNNSVQECFKFDAKSRQDHLKRYLRQTKINRQAKVWANRDLFLMGLSNEKQNLGNALNITDQYIEDLSGDPDQTVCLTNPMFDGPFQYDDEGNLLKFILIQSETQMEVQPELKRLYEQANAMVKQEFATKDMLVHLDWSMDEGMTIDLLIKETPTLFSCTNEVVGLCEYVFMKKYLWLEVIAIQPNFRNLGIGRLLMERLIHIAANRHKDILLYALEDVVPFYQHLGFEFCQKFPHKPYHDGWFMTKKLS